MCDSNHESYRQYPSFPIPHDRPEPIPPAGSREARAPVSRQRCKKVERRRTSCLCPAEICCIRVCWGIRVDARPVTLSGGVYDVAVQGRPLYPASRDLDVDVAWIRRRRSGWMPSATRQNLWTYGQGSPFATGSAGNQPCKRCGGRSSHERSRRRPTRQRASRPLGMPQTQRRFVKRTRTATRFVSQSPRDTYLSDRFGCTGDGRVEYGLCRLRRAALGHHSRGQDEDGGVKGSSPATGPVSGYGP